MLFTLPLTCNSIGPIKSIIGPAGPLDLKRYNGVLMNPPLEVNKILMLPHSAQGL